MDVLAKQVRSLKQNTLQLTWYMRGGLSYEEAMTLSKEERDLIIKIVKENMEITKKSGLPYF